MLIGFKQFVPSLVCLSCDGCCRFKEAESLWQPKISIEEIKQAEQNGLARKIFAKAVAPKGGPLKTIPCADGHCCTFFNRDDSICKIYEHRPFECQLYPFLLTRRQNEIYLAVHLLCPFVQEQYDTSHYAQYVQYLKEFFRQEAPRKFVGRNDILTGDYSLYKDEIEYLFKIEAE